MKKILALMLLFCIAIGNSAMAEIPDISNLTVDDLIELKNEVELQLYALNKTTVLDAGTYVVGRDIAPGTYVIREYSSDPDRDTDWGVKIFLTADDVSRFQKDYNEYTAKYDTAVARKKNGEEFEYPAELTYTEYYRFTGIESESSGRITLSDGEVMQVYVWGYSGDNTSRLIIEKSSPLFMD